MARPSNLPDYKAPPVKEVAFSIQFERPESFNQMLVRDIWELFKDQHPNSKIEPRLAPIFETFSGAFRDTRKSNIKFEANQGPIENRCVFYSSDKSEVIHFQSDRFSLIWKESPEFEYPRYEPIFEEFKTAFCSLQKLFLEQDWGEIEPNQCELVYSNRIPFEEIVDVASRIRIGSIHGLSDIEGFQFHFTQKIKSEGEPYARVFVNAWTSLDSSNKPYLLLNITVRGRPLGESLSACWEFFDEAHVRIVEMFTQITSDAAHKDWGRTK